MIGFIAFVVVFSVLIFVHELGHFVAARLAGVKVEEFGIGFPPRLVRLGAWRGTEITLNLLPIGGFVRLVEEDASDPKSLASRGRGTRALVHSAGALMNLLLACILYAATYMGGTLVPVDGPGAGIYAVVPGSPAELAGMEAGDNILSIAGQEVLNPDTVVDVVLVNLGRPIDVVLERDGEPLPAVVVTPRTEYPEDEGAMGISLGDPLQVRSYPILEAIPLGVRATYNSLATIVWAIKSAILHQLDLQLTGFIGMYSMTAEVAQAGMVELTQLAAWLSVNLFLLNLLPLPALDGGKMVFIFLEWVRGGKRVAPEKEGLVHAIGMVLLLAVTVVITVMDYVRYFG